MALKTMQHCFWALHPITLPGDGLSKGLPECSSSHAAPYTAQSPQANPGLGCNLLLLNVKEKWGRNLNPGPWCLLERRNLNLTFYSWMKGHNPTLIIFFSLSVSLSFFPPFWSQGCQNNIADPLVFWNRESSPVRGITLLLFKSAQLLI